MDLMGTCIELLFSQIFFNHPNYFKKNKKQQHQYKNHHHLEEENFIYLFIVLLIIKINLHLKLKLIYTNIIENLITQILFRLRKKKEMNNFGS